MAENRVIGSGNKIPWRLSEEFKWFKKITMGKTLLMGRKTFESIGKPLPGRRTIVLSRGGFLHEGVKTIKDLAEL
ncbi:MAG: dihydrofolate reductase, partial [Opitutaceae bacterium]|nr:dihydrofolate reductase [Opitutaceae bacterium]